MHFEDYPQDPSIRSMNKSVENLLLSSREVLSSITSSSMVDQSPQNSFINGNCNEGVFNASFNIDKQHTTPLPSPNTSPHLSPKVLKKRDSTSKSFLNTSYKDILSVNKLDEKAQEHAGRLIDTTEPSKQFLEAKKEGRGSNRSKKKSWYYNILYPTYKKRSEDFKRIFKDVPDEERLIVDYSCALQREILVHGRLYVSQNYMCFHATIFKWETLVSLQWKDVTAVTKEKTALVIPNAILISASNEKFFLTSFGSRDKTYMMLFRVWQNALIGQPMSVTEMWQLVHNSYGDELGLTSDDEDYIPPLLPIPNEIKATHCSLDESIIDAEIAKEDKSTTLINVESQMEIPSLSIKTGTTVIDATDLSDTTESETEKHPLKGLRKGVATCTSPHDGRQLAKTSLPIYIDQLFTLLFTNSKFFLDFHTARKTTDLVQSAWTQDANSDRKIRTVSLTVSLTQAVGPRSSQITEEQIMLPCSRPGYLYSIDVEAVSAGIPYADSFIVCTHFCITSLSEIETSLTVYGKIKYKKNVWGIVKSFIEKNCYSGMEEYFDSLIKALSVECDESGTGTEGLKRKSRRRRRTASGLTIHNSPDHTAFNQVPAIDLPLGRNSNVADSGGNNNSTVVSWILLVAVLCLMVINGLLYYKLWGLEDTATYTILDLHVLKNTPKTEEDWINLIQQQESLHNVEMRKWQRILHTAAQLLRQTEESLTELQMSIHPTTTEKVFSVLKPGLQTLKSRAESHTKQDF